MKWPLLMGTPPPPSWTPLAQHVEPWQEKYVHEFPSDSCWFAARAPPPPSRTPSARQNGDPPPPLSAPSSNVPNPLWQRAQVSERESISVKASVFSLVSIVCFFLWRCDQAALQLGQTWVIRILTMFWCNFWDPHNVALHQTEFETIFIFSGILFKSVFSHSVCGSQILCQMAFLFEFVWTSFICPWDERQILLSFLQFEICFVNCKLHAKNDKSWWQILGNYSAFSQNVNLSRHLMCWLFSKEF